MATQIHTEDQAMMSKHLPEQVLEFSKKERERICSETYDKEVQNLKDQLLFIDLDKQKTGRLCFEDFREFAKAQVKEMMHSVDDKKNELSEEQLCFRYKFGCSLAESESGPSIRAIQKWNNIMRDIDQQK